VLIHDDLLATGGTAAAAAELVKMRGANVTAFNFIIELEFLKGRQKLEDYARKIITLAAY
jgi:adenine phosphoribosyltransferase